MNEQRPSNQRWKVEPWRVEELKRHAEILLSTLNVHECAAVRDMIDDGLPSADRAAPEPLADREEIAQDLRAVEAFLERAQSMRHSLLIAAAMADRASIPPKPAHEREPPHCSNCSCPPYEAEPNWKHPKLQALLASEARLKIERDMIATLIDNPAAELCGLSDYETELTEKLRDRSARPPASNGRADEIVSRLYRRFKDWSKRGFGPEDVTWCEVKADIEAMIRTSEPPGAGNSCVEPVPCVSHIALGALEQGVREWIERRRKELSKSGITHGHYVADLCLLEEVLDGPSETKESAL